MERSEPFCDALKSRAGVKLFEPGYDNRDKIPFKLLDEIKDSLYSGSDE